MVKASAAWESFLFFYLLVYLNTNLNAVETNVANLMFKKILKVTGTSGASNVDTKIANFPSGADWTNTVILSCMVEWTAASKKMFAHQYEWCFLKSDGIYFTSATAEFSVKPVEIVIGIY